MPNEKKFNKKYFLIFLSILVVTMGIFLFLAIHRMENYITQNGESNMSAVIEQMEQTYDLQIGNLYTRLERIENNLFQGKNRSILLSENKRFLDGMTDDKSGQILFIKENGQVMTIDGAESYLDIQSSSLMKLQKKENLAQSVSWNGNSGKESCYLVAIPCDTFYVDDVEFSAIGFLFDRANIDSLFEMNGYGGQAILFSVDETGTVIYTNQEGDKYYRNYSLLKHMNKEGAISDQEYIDFKEKIETLATGVKQIGIKENKYYIGFYPLKSSNNELICMVPVNVLNSSLLEYQNTVIRMIVIGMMMLLILSLVLFYMTSKMTSAMQKAQFEEETRKIKEEAMAALEVERDRADYANQAKSQFLSNMSHDIRTPMNAIVGFTSLALAHIDDGKDVIQDYLEKISISSDHLLSLINDVLDMSRIESGQVHIQEGECSLPTIAHGLSNILQSSIAAKNLNFYIDTVDVEHENIICDKLRVNQILINIVSNAIKYTQPGGTVRVKFEETNTAPEGYADFVFTVKDNGIGMDPKFLETIFDPFTREKNSTVSKVEGTGLGMAITKNIVDMMGGTITVSSIPNVGSEFVVKFRFKTVEDKNEITVIPELNGFRALVADDNMDSCGSAVKMLRAVGMRPEWTTSGKEVVFRTKMSIEENDPFKVYIIDWLMPDINGIEVARRVREEIGNDIPIIILTAYDWHSIEKEAREAGVTAFCSKPLFLSELYKVLQNTEYSEEKETPKEIDMKQFAGKEVLLADDVEVNREIAVAILEEAGIIVKTAENGQEAVDILKSNPNEFDLVLMDVMMPIMDGYEATKEIRKMNDEKLRNIPIIAMTANAFEEDKQAALEAGMNDHLAKPFQIAKLYEMMVKYL